MFNFDLHSLLSSLVYTLPAIVLALTGHEYAHARVAYAFGDPTAKDAGRLTLNPLKHLDIIGTLCLVLFRFGWAKPVPINPYYFQGDRRKKIMAVSVAGPVSNLIQALVATVVMALLLRFTNIDNWGGFYWLNSFISYYIQINIILAVFNLIPIPPLDGSKILAGLLPESKMNVVLALERYGFVILILLMASGLLSRIISPLVNLIFSWLMRLMNFLI